jgi:RNA polymerase sigma factor (sigma-70 family)
MTSPGSPDEVGTAAPTTETPARSFPAPRSDSEQLDGDAATLAQGLIAGDVGALAEVYRQTSSLVFTIALRTLASQPDAEDVTERVYVQAWRSSATYDPTRRPLRAWLVAITRHVVADKMAERSRQTRLERRLDEDDGDDEVDEVSRVEEASEDGIAGRIADAVVVADGLSRLEQHRRQVVEMSFFDGLTHSQISEALAIPVGSVKSHIKRGLAQLRRQLGVSDGAS